MNKANVKVTVGVGGSFTWSFVGLSDEAEQDILANVPAIGEQIQEDMCDRDEEPTGTFYVQVQV